jgi:hypothetical protein
LVRFDPILTQDPRRAVDACETITQQTGQLLLLLSRQHDVGKLFELLSVPPTSVGIGNRCTT